MFAIVVHVDNRKKLDPSGEKGLLVVYNEISKSYRVYITARITIIVSRDFLIDEDRTLQRYLDLQVEQQPTQ